MQDKPKKVACLDPSITIVPKPGFAQRKQSLQAYALRAAFEWREQAKTDPPGADAETTDALIAALDRLEDHCLGGNPT